MKKKQVGWIILIIALFFINPIPGIDDTIGLKMYSAFSGENFSLNDISAIYLNYTIWSITVGIFILLIALYFLGWNHKRLLKELGIDKFKLSLGLSVVVLLIVIYFNLNSLITYFLIGFVGFVYYSKRKDKSETIALILTPLILTWFGFSQLLSYVMNKLPIPEVLESNGVVSWISNQLGFIQITNVSLIISSIIGVILVLLVTKVLKDKF